MADIRSNLPDKKEKYLLMLSKYVRLEELNEAEVLAKLLDSI